MKIERLISIVMILLQNKKVTASYLADRFDVSKRTIYRDIMDICLAGIPVMTISGSQGGLIIDEDYKIDKTLFNEKELRAILIGLSSLHSISSNQKYQKIMNKFFMNENGIYANPHIMIDLSSHYKDTLAPKIEEFQEAIESSLKVTFRYLNVSGERQVILDSYCLVFKWSSWYIFGYDNDKKEVRLFKLNRLWDLKILEETFEVIDIPEEKYDFNQYFTNEIQAVILFDKSVKYQLIEEYGKDCYKEVGDKLRFEFPFTNKDYLLSWVLSFGDLAELIEPQAYRQIIKDRAENLLRKYCNDDI